ncbi:hypothetical protein I7I51_01542 [Histoplasma capsulatum]|uniref:Uncharacterized protein n=1 Tax=Ajellomyces capsulatus TaxID=5037 RepID=A0A8A1MIP8_AJECA|nr:hypothetical protein I7I51_01542 [Histoplasma capsulatum]
MDGEVSGFAPKIRPQTAATGHPIASGAKECWPIGGPGHGIDDRVAPAIPPHWINSPEASRNRSAHWKAAPPSALQSPEPIAGNVGQKPQVIPGKEITMSLVRHRPPWDMRSA